MTSKHLIALLLSAPTVTAIVGQRIHSKKVPQYVDLSNDGPYLVVRQSGGGHLKATGSNPGRIGFQNPLFGLIAYALDDATADSILDAAGTFLDGTPATTNVNVTAGGKTIHVAAILEDDDEAEDWLPSPHAAETGVHTATASFRMWCSEER